MSIVVQRFETKRSCYGFSPLLFTPLVPGERLDSPALHCFWMRKIKSNHNGWNWISYTRLCAITRASVSSAVWPAAVDEAFSIYTSAPLLNVTVDHLPGSRQTEDWADPCCISAFAYTKPQTTGQWRTYIITSTPTVLTCKYITSFQWLKESSAESRAEGKLKSSQQIYMSNQSSSWKQSTLSHMYINLYSIYTCAKEMNIKNQRWVTQTKH